MTAIRRLLPRRLSTQALAGAALATGVGIALYGAYLATELTTRMRQQIATQAGAVAALAADSARVAIGQRDEASLAEVLGRFGSMPGVDRVDAFGAAGFRMAAAASHPPPAPEPASTRVPASLEPHLVGARRSTRGAPPAGVALPPPARLDAWHPVGTGGNDWIRVRYSTASADEAMRNLWLDTLAAGAIVMALSVAMTMLLLRRPLRRLANATAFASRLDTDFGRRMHTHPLNVELDGLVIALNRASIRLADQHRALAQSESRMRAMHDATLDCVVTIDGEGRIVEFNPAAERTFGYARDEAIGRDMAELLVPQEMRDAHRAGLERLREGGERRIIGQRLRLAALRRDGARLPIELVIVPVPVGDHQLYTAYMRDVTTQERVEIELRAAKEAAEAANQAKSDFVANMSHEIRTPLNGVIGMTDLALECPVDDEVREYLQTARSSADSLLAIINDILDFSKIEAGRMRLESTGFNLRDEMDMLIKPLAAQAQAKSLDLVFDIDDSVPERIVGDPVRIGQILVNLVGNAVKFTAAGEVSIHVRARDADEHQLRLEWIVRDTGIGIPEEKQRIIFDAFSQADTSTTRRFGGTGLGLAICRRLCSMMNGAIEVHSEPGRGTSFSFSVVVGADAIEARPPGPDLRGLRLLLVEHSPSCHALFERACVHAGATATWAADLESAREVLAEGAAFDALVVDAPLLDAVGVGQSPWDLLGPAIHAGDRGTEVPRVMLASAAHRLLRDQKTCRDHARSAAFIKPVTVTGWLRVLAAERTAEVFDDEIDVHPAQPAESLPCLHILLVEDNPVNQHLATRLLERAGHQVSVAENGREALDALTVARRPFDLVLMDVQMPIMGGIAATQAIRERERSQAAHGVSVRRLPIVAMTARAMEGDRELCLDAGMDDYVTKPVRRQNLFDTIARLLALRSPAPAARAAVAPAAPTARPQAGHAPAPPARAGAAAEGPRYRLEDALELFGGDTELLEHITGLLVKTTPDLLDELDRAAASDDFERVGYLAHKIKGSLGSVGADRARAHSQSLEILAERGIADPEIARHAGALRACYEEVVGVLATA